MEVAKYSILIQDEIPNSAPSTMFQTVWRILKGSGWSWSVCRDLIGGKSDILSICRDLVEGKSLGRR